MVRPMPRSASSPLSLAIGGMLGMTAAMGIGRFFYTPILPGMMEGLGLSASQAGWIASVNYLGYLLGAIGAAYGWAQGRERALGLLGVGGSAVLAALMAMTESFSAFIVIRLLAGIASAFMMVFLGTVVFARLMASDRNDLQALHFGGVGVGIAVSALVTAALAITGGTWQAGWIGAAVLSAIAFAAVVVLVPPGAAATAAPVREPPLPPTRAMRRMTLAYGLFGFGYVITATFLIAIVRTSQGGALFESTVWLVTGASIVVSTWIWNAVARRIGLTAAFAAAMVVEAAGVVASVTLGSYVGPLIAAVLLGGTFVAATAIGLQAGRRMADASPRRALGLMTAAFGFGQIVGPIFAGYIADLTGTFFVPSLGAALVLVLSAILAWDAGRRSAVR